MTDLPDTLEDFRATRTEMSATAFGELIGDLMWEDEPDTTFLVYADTYYIEVLDDGRYLLTLENTGSITGSTDGDKTLEDIEEELFEFARDAENVPRP